MQGTTLTQHIRASQKGHANARGELTALLTEIGVAGKVIVLIGSDFGRTPGYNDGNGKDHWSVSSFMAMGPGIVGNRVVGASTASHKPLTVNPETLALDENGIRITPGHINTALRALAGIDNDILSAHYPLKEGLLPIFTG